MSTSTSSRPKRHVAHEEEEHENHERWLVTYADLITLLMVLFIVMFAISQVDSKKFAALAEGLASGFGGDPRVVTVGGTGVTEESGGIPRPLDLVGRVEGEAVPEAAVDAARLQGERQDAEAAAEAARREVQDLRELEEALRAALARKGLEDQVRFTISDRGLAVVLASDDLFFASGSARLEDRGVEVLDALAPVLVPLPNALSVEGHANHLAIRSAAFPSNWELSAARAGSVVRRLEADGVASGRMTAVGYGTTRPLVPVEDPRALSVNRRVDLMVVSDEPAEVRALLPLLAQG